MVRSNISHQPTSSSGGAIDAASKSVAHTGAASRQMMLPGRGSPQHSPTGLGRGTFGVQPRERPGRRAGAPGRAARPGSTPPTARAARSSPASVPAGTSQSRPGGAPVDVVHAREGGEAALDHARAVGAARGRGRTPRSCTADSRPGPGRRRSPSRRTACPSTAGSRSNPSIGATGTSSGGRARP